MHEFEGGQPRLQEHSRSAGLAFGGRVMKRRRRGILFIVGCVALLTTLLTVCLFSFAVPTLRTALRPLTNVPGGTPPSATPAEMPTATGVPSDTLNWSTIQIDGAFRIDMPRVLACPHGFFINDFSGTGCDFTYAGAPLATPLAQVEAQAQVAILYSTKITDHPICPVAGLPLSFGPYTPGGPVVQGRQETNAPPTPTDTTAGTGPYVQFSVVLNGLAIRVQLSALGPSETFFARYGAIWQHMVNSFAPLPHAVQQPTHPCGP